MKRKLITLLRICNAGIKSLVRNAWLAVAAIAVMVITLTIMLFSVIANATLSNTINQITDRIDISVYLVDSIKIDQKDNLISELKKLENVKSVDYVSKEQALERYKEQNKNNVELLTAISQTDNPLPASLQIKPYDTEDFESIRQFLEKPEIKKLQSEQTSYSGDRKQAIDKISRAATFFRQSGLIGVVVFAIISMLIIFNTIRMAIFNRKEELTIMRLLGASNSYIRGPFVVETMLYGVVAAVLSIALCSALFAVSSSALGASSLGLLDITYADRYFKDNILFIIVIQIALGIIIGATSALVATRRYLKFKSSK